MSIIVLCGSAIGKHCPEVVENTCLHIVAKSLGIHRTLLCKKMEKYGIALEQEVTM